MGKSNNRLPMSIFVFFEQKNNSTINQVVAWCRWSGSNRHVLLRTQDFKSCASAISPHRHYRHNHRLYSFALKFANFIFARLLLFPSKHSFCGSPIKKRPKRLEAPPRFELGMRVLQTRALPLGDGATVTNCIFASLLNYSQTQTKHLFVYFIPLRTSSCGNLIY